MTKRRVTVGRWMAVGSACVLVLAAGAAGQTGAPAGTKPPTAPASPARANPALEQQVEEILASAEKAGNAKAAAAALQSLCDRIAMTAEAGSLERIVAADGPRCFFEAISAAKGDECKAWVKLYRDHRDAFDALALATRPVAGPKTAMYAKLRELIQQRGEVVGDLPNLAAAVAAVHDAPLRRQINENMTTGSSAVDVLDYFAKYRSGLALDPKTTPAEVLVYVVDVTAKVPELEWARAEYKRAPDVGRCYFQIRYDDAHFKRGGEKAVTKSGMYDLAAIRKFGGVCADQAHYSGQVGKAFGIPTAYARASGAEVGHAWIGQYKVAGARSAWDFSAGRYDDYKNLRGSVQDPVTDEWISDGEVALVAELGRRSLRQRQMSAALADVAERWAKAGPKGTLEPVPGVAAAKTARKNDVAGRMELLRIAVDACPADAIAWRTMTAEARKGSLSVGELTEWSTALLKLTQETSPDFAMETLSEMFAGVKDAGEQVKLWDWAYGRFSKRPDLASTARFRQAALYRAGGNSAKAWDAYNDVATRFANDSPDAAAAVRGMLTLLDESGKRSEAAAPMLERIWKLTKQPGQMGAQFRTQSNWFKVGAMLADEYGASGKTRQRADVLRRLGVGESGD